MPKPFSVPEQHQQLLQLKTAVEAARLQYQSAKTEYERYFERRQEIVITLPTGNTQRIVSTYSCCVQRYQRATMDLNHYLLDRAFPAAQPKAFSAAR